jgi:3'-phosphoadenosine 5'-phosphosulfate sulfotransferase (PAPS reductase)/FAD synthetase
MERQAQVNDPFRIEGPACISFSGGRTSAYMLWRILQAHGGTLPEDVLVMFANTGKEMPQTLDFVLECSERWNVPITWVEYQQAEKAPDRWRIVDWHTASRNGEPFAAMIEQERYLPNPVARLCTKNLKIIPMHLCMESFGFDEFDEYIGMRADEPRRLAKIQPPRYAPLATARVSVSDVSEFWMEAPFDLRLSSVNGQTSLGNCDLCFLKGVDQLLSVIRQSPSKAIWWMEQENKIDSGGSKVTFRSDRPSYAAMHRMATNHGELFAFDDEAIECGVCID